MAALLHVLGALLVALATPGVHAQVAGPGITTDKAVYRAGETITICYTVPGPGAVTITDYSSDGSSAVLLAVDDDGTGWCFVAIAQGPASAERLALSWSDGNQRDSAETFYQVVTAATTHVLTLADNNSTLTVALGDTIEARLGATLNWHLAVSDPAVLQPSPAPLPADAQGVWFAVGAGQAVISGRGDPLCYPRCLAPSRLFTVTVVVR